MGGHPSGPGEAPLQDTPGLASRGIWAQRSRGTEQRRATGSRADGLFPGGARLCKRWRPVSPPPSSPSLPDADAETGRKMGASSRRSARSPAGRCHGGSRCPQQAGPAPSSGTGLPAPSQLPGEPLGERRAACPGFISIDWKYVVRQPSCASLHSGFLLPLQQCGLCEVINAHLCKVRKK